MSQNSQQEPAFAATFAHLKQQDELLYRYLLEKGSFAHLKKHQLICDQGLACSHLALLINGTARVYKLAENGKEITLYRIGPGESCVLTASCILSSAPFPAIAVSETEIDALLIPASSVNQWLAESSAWRDYVFGLVAKRLSSIISVVEEVAFKRMDQRIVDYLLEHTSTTNHRLLATHQEIASELGTSREVVSRILKDLENEGLLLISRGTIEVTDNNRLREKSSV